MAKLKKTWRDELVTVGNKYVGRPIFWVYTHDQDYLYVLRDDFGSSAARQAIEHKDKADPFYHDQYLSRGFRD